MSSCVQLFQADNINAFYSMQHKALVITADVSMNPFSHQVQICRNPLEMLLPVPAVREYIVVAATRPGIHPDLVVKRTISGSFSMDLTPAKVAVYSMGIDNPARTEVNVGSQPPQTSTPSQPSTTPKTSAPSTGALLQATGWSTDFVLQDAFSNAVTELRAATGFRYPDVGLPFKVVEIGGQVDGFTLHTGAFITVQAV